jgi:NAD+ synthase|tara:strand:- start:873 stop:1643 length:771 start_codon:yes stop_codon:yes gene_type:complete
MRTKEVIKYIKEWILQYNKESKTKGFVIGISGGIDSALTSTLIAETRLPLLCIEMPIHQNKKEILRGKKHIAWLKEKYNNVSSIEFNLTSVFDNFKNQTNDNNDNSLALANTRSRLRMTSLYYFAQINNYLVAGTGNKVEDFGIGFFTKYGDGGVDLSPIADLLKTEVFTLSKELNIINDILIAPPTDGLWDNEKTDEDQIGATYKELEWAMNLDNLNKNLSKREQKVLTIYKKLNKANKHKILPIPVCLIPENLK